MMRVTYCWCAAVKVIEILIQGIAVELDSNNLFNRRIGNTERFLETFQNTFTILMGELYSGGLSAESSNSR